MIESTDTTSRTRQVSITASPFITVSSILAFADELRAKNMPPRERVDCEHAHETRHLIRLRVRTTDSSDTPPAGEQPPEPPGDPEPPSDDPPPRDPHSTLNATTERAPAHQPRNRRHTTAQPFGFGGTQ